MISKNDLISVGHSFKTHGYKGEVTVTFDVDYELFLKADYGIFLDIEGCMVPFFIKNIRKKGNDDCFVHLDGMESDEDATLAVNKELFMLRANLAEALGVEADELEEVEDDIIGYKVIEDEGTQPIGVVEDIEEGVEYPYLSVRLLADNRLVSIPFVEDFVVSVKPGDEGNEGVIVMSIPSGLLSLDDI